MGVILSFGAKKQHRFTTFSSCILLAVLAIDLAVFVIDLAVLAIDLALTMHSLGLKTPVVVKSTAEVNVDKMQVKTRLPKLW